MFIVSFLVGMGAMLLLLQVSGFRVPVGRETAMLRDWFGRVRFWHVATAIAAMSVVWMFNDPYAARSGLPQMLLTAMVALLLIAAWVREFRFLMALGDEDFPGRFDKPIWAAVLIVLAPVGLFLFRSHRLAHWPEAKPKPAVDPAHELA